jgi:hypothetical protein
LLNFLEDQPGLVATAESNLDYLLSYVPQLGIQGCAGFLEPLIDSVFFEASSSIKARPTSGTPGWFLRAPDLCGLDSDDIVAHYFWSTDPAGTSPYTSVLAWVDAAAWIASTASDWLPSVIKEHMSRGLASLSMQRRMQDCSAMTWDIRANDRWRDIMYSGPDEMDQQQFVHAARNVFKERIAVSRKLLELPESPDELVNRISSWGVFESYWTHNASPQF